MLRGSRRRWPAGGTALGWMLMAAALVLTPSPLHAQTAVPGQSLAWLFPSAVAESVTRFEANYDGTGFVSVGLVPHPTTPDQFYAPIPALITGPHTVEVRACNVAGCGPSGSLAFSMVAGAPSAVPAGAIGIIPTPPGP